MKQLAHSAASAVDSPVNPAGTPQQADPKGGTIAPLNCHEPKAVREARPDERNSWRALALLGALLAPAASVLWLGLTLAGSGSSIAFALVKIIFTIVVVMTGVAGVRWSTAAGSALLLEAAVVAAWIILKVEAYPPFGAVRTTLMLAIPVAASGVMLILADGIRAGTWPHARFKETAGK